MTFRNVMLAIAVVGMAVNLYSRRQGARRPAAGVGPPRSDEGPSGALEPAAGLPGQGSESPNPVERMQADNLMGSPVGAGSPLADSGQGDLQGDLSPGSFSEQEDTPVKTGLPDFTRGA